MPETKAIRRDGKTRPADRRLSVEESARMLIRAYAMAFRELAKY